VIGHRGYNQQAPENTLPSFRLALAARADLVELDYHHTKDGVPLVIHDGTLDRTTDATNRWGGKDVFVRSRDLADLRTLDAGRWFGPAFAGTPLPTLVEAVEAIQAGGVTLIERKGGDAATLVRLLRERGWATHLVVQSFDWAFVREAHRLAPELVLGALGPPSSRNGRKLKDEEKVLTPEFIADIETLGAKLVVWNRQVTEAAVAHAHQRGLRVWVYTINEPKEAAGLVRLGVDGIITDNPGAIRAGLHPQADESAALPPTRVVAQPLPEHPGNIYLEGETVRVRLPEGLPTEVTGWRLQDDQGQTLRSGKLSSETLTAGTPLALDGLGIGWYRLEFDTVNRTNVAWTTTAVLKRLAAPVPGDSPVCVDSATAWFAPDDVPKQQRFANLAVLAGVNWVRDRLRWRDLQPGSGPLTAGRTTYDTAAEVQYAAGLKVLQVFHDTPPWAREAPDAGGRFAPDLRHAFALGRGLAERFQGRVAAWEPWNEANIVTFGGHTVDQMCAWQKAAWLGFKAGDPEVIVGWNVTTTVPTPAQTEGVLANETWCYFDTYNIHSYDWSHAYAELWKPARAAVSGRPLWVSESDRGTPHLKQGPWFDQDPRLERLKAEWLAQSYASSLFAGTRRHFHFILGHYHEPNGVQFGLLRLDFTPRPAYAALATVGRCLAGARVLGRYRPGSDVSVYAFRAFPDGQERDVLVAWAEKEADWDGRGRTSATWKSPVNLDVQEVVDYLGRSRAKALPSTLSSAPVFVFLPPGQAATLPLEPPPSLAPVRAGTPSPVVLQLSLPRNATVRVEDLPWSEGHAYAINPGQLLDLPIHAYNFSPARTHGRLTHERSPEGWDVQLPGSELTVEPNDRLALHATLRVPERVACRDGWVVLRADCGAQGQPVLAFRVLVRD
jgi:glycerophosphoryl diester phosphodiesterase